MNEAVLILGLDPGLRTTGWGIIACQGSALRYVASGHIHPQTDGELASRLSDLYAMIETVIDAHTPHEAAVEETFINNNPRSALKLGQARGVCLLAPARHSLPVAEYAANVVKKSVVGAGHADKRQVAMMVGRLLPGAGTLQADEADALAVAICHASHRRPLRQAVA